jgi:hypothetical protein
MTVKEIVRRYLIDNSFDGLYADGECGCVNDDLLPCGGDCTDCKPGYVHMSNDEDYDFYIKPERESIGSVQEKY